MIILVSTVNLNLLLPEYNCEESYKIDLCIRVEFWDENCNVCEQLICFDGIREFPEIPGEGNPDWRPAGNGSSNLKPELKLNSKEIKVYPNPASSEFTIEVDKEFSGSNVDIFNEKGSLVKRVVLQNEITKVNATDLTNEVYFLNVEKSNKRANGKIVIH